MDVYWTDEFGDNVVVDGFDKPFCEKELDEKEDSDYEKGDDDG